MDEQSIKNLHKEFHAQGIISIRIKPKEKRPLGGNWQTQQLLSPEQINQQPYLQNEGVGLLTNDLLALDLDIADKETEYKIISLFPTAPRKKGKLGSTILFAKHPDYTYSQTQKLLTAQGIKRDQIQILTGQGHQTVVPPSIHPDTLEPYFWEVPLKFPLPQFLGRKEFAEALKNFNLPNEVILNEKVKLNIAQFCPEKAKNCPISQPDQELLKEWIKLLREDQWQTIDNGDYYRRNLWAINYIFKGHESGIPFALLFTKDPETFCSGKGRERLTREQYAIQRYRSCRLERSTLTTYNHLIFTSNKLGVPIPEFQFLKDIEIDKYTSLWEETPIPEATKSHGQVIFKGINKKLYDKFFSVHGCERMATHQTISTILFAFPRIKIHGDCSTNIISLLGGESGSGKSAVWAFNSLPCFSPSRPKTEEALHKTIEDAAFLRKSSLLWVYTEGELLRPKTSEHNNELTAQMGDYFSLAGKPLKPKNETKGYQELLEKDCAKKYSKEKLDPFELKKAVLEEVEAYKMRLASLTTPKINAYVATQPKYLMQFTTTPEWSESFARRSYVCLSGKQPTGPKKETIDGYQAHFSIQEEIEELTAIQPFLVLELFSKLEDYNIVMPIETIEVFNSLTQDLFDEFEEYGESIRTIVLSSQPLLKKLAFAIQTGNEGRIGVISEYYLKMAHIEFRNHVLDCITLLGEAQFERNKAINQKKAEQLGALPVNNAERLILVKKKLKEIFEGMPQGIPNNFSKVTKVFESWKLRPSNVELISLINTFENILITPNPSRKNNYQITKK